MITVALIDKHPILRTGLSIFLHGHFNDIIILESSTITAFHETYPDGNPNLIILGTSQQTGLNTSNYIDKLKQWYRVETVIIFEEKPSRATTTNYLKAGVRGYILKKTSLSDLAICIEDVLKGKHYLCNEAFEIILEKNTPKRARLTKPALNLSA